MFLGGISIMLDNKSIFETYKLFRFVLAAEHMAVLLLVCWFDV